MRLLVVALVALVAGCAAPSASVCPADANILGVVLENRGESILVDAQTGNQGPMVFHLTDTKVLFKTGDACKPGLASDAIPGRRFQAVARGPVMESFPPQTHPSILVIER
jgi:hypothetical protein